MFCSSYFEKRKIYHVKLYFEIFRFSFSSSRGDLRLEACVRRGHELTANVQQLSQILHSLRLKLHISRYDDL